MLNLRQVDQRSENHLSNTAHRSTIRFNASIAVGNMGESLEFGTRGFDDNLGDEPNENGIAHLTESGTSLDVRSL
jgi:hypothetical protein